MALRVPYKRVDWINTAFLLVVTLVAVIAAPIYIWKHGVDGFQIGMFAFYSIATGMSITLGYHRLFSHLSFKAKWPVRLFTLVFGACAFENSVINWASDHRRHHKHVDHDDDPYNIQNGFFWAHIGWILFKVLPEPPLDNVADLRKDPLVRFQHRFDKLIAVVVGLGLPAALGYWHGGPEGALGGFLIAGALRVFVVQQCTFFINSLCHTIGRQPYSSNNSARDSMIMAFLTFGEGYHNFHHAFQHDYRNGVKAWNWDPTKWAIWLLSKLGLVSDLRTVPEEKIALAEIAEARRRAAERLAHIEEHGLSVCDKALATVHDLQDRLSAAYHELEKAVSERADMSGKALNRWRREARELVAALSQLTPLPA